MDNMTKKAIWKGIAAIIGVLIVAAAVCTALVIVWPLGGGSIIRNMKSSKIELQEIVPLAAEAQIKEKIRIAGSGDAVSAEEEKESNLTADYIIRRNSTMQKMRSMQGMDECLTPRSSRIILIVSPGIKLSTLQLSLMRKAAAF